MFKKIIWATDGSEHAARALELAANLTRTDGATLHAVHVTETYPSSRAAGLAIRLDEDEIAERVQEQLRPLSRRGVVPVVHLLHAPAGTIAKRIAQTAREVDADLIVVGTRGHSALAGVMLGSVSQRLLHVAPCPVLAVPPVRDGGPVPERPHRDAALAG